MLTIANPLTSASTPLGRISGVSEALSSPASLLTNLCRQGTPATLYVKGMEEQLFALRASLICAFNQLLDLKDLNTGVHSTRLAEWALHVAGELGLDENALSDIEVAALLHDIGKIGIPDAILQKPAKLTDAEYDLMKKHPEYGWAVLRHVPGMERASLMILHHHESYDGKGYPAGLKGEEIPIGSRIVSVIDAFDAMVSSRPYREGLPFEEAERRCCKRGERNSTRKSLIVSFLSHVRKCRLCLLRPARRFRLRYSFALSCHYRFPKAPSIQTHLKKCRNRVKYRLTSLVSRKCSRTCSCPRSPSFERSQDSRGGIESGTRFLRPNEPACRYAYESPVTEFRRPRTRLPASSSTAPPSPSTRILREGFFER